MTGDTAVRVARAPGRVNLIGEHTDYNDGFVLPVAIDLELRLTYRVRDDSQVRLTSRETAGVADSSLGAQNDMGGGAQHDTDGWGRYVEGVRELLQPERGIDGEIVSRIPVGAGLSSSAALELAVARALVAANGGDWKPLAMAKLCQRAETEYARNRCGIMDQLAVACGQAGQALFVDCRSLEIEPVPLPLDVAIVVCDSAVPRRLVESAYNARRADCEAAARALRVPSLRDATPDMLAGLRGRAAKRARHVVAENQRVMDFVAALRASERSQMGELMAASHASLRDLFEVSCPELDLLVELARSEPGCIGSRLTGAGFGGCTVSLVESDAATRFAREVMVGYRRRTGLPATAYISRAVDGVSVSAA